MLKKNGGITLIALVITIIVLLILAGVSIAMISGQDGILGRASKASIQNQLGGFNDAVSLFVSDKMTEYYDLAYAAGNTQVSAMSLDKFLASTVTVSSLTNPTTGVSGLTNGEATSTLAKVAVTGTEDAISTIVLSMHDSSGYWTSTGTVSNGKVKWAITGPSSTNPITNP